MEELPVGSEITLRVVEDVSCEGCYFSDLDYDIYGNCCKKIKCGAEQRKDGKYVKFVKVKMTWQE